MVDWPVVVGTAGVLGVAVAVIVRVRAVGRRKDLVDGALRDRRPARRAWSDDPPVREMPAEAEVIAEIAELLDRGKWRQATYVLRGHTGMAGEDAKRLVAEIGAGRHPATWPVRTPGVGDDWEFDPFIVDRALTLRKRGRKADAVRLLCERLGAPLSEATKLVN
ncbi:hypothetical protein [Polymorphospora rubra]|uniref:Ribosomal protein L7/L12 C-terminal domain-containing protein n=1 Tax=Polymorphospora rubra TaxID=338584 RepID=A0A810MPL8_9ACTN|nr:hypothetical protein [Polymorphospora rubra]BCJ63246.1 hypothetical protein Prubr_02670 [Polymorphospora rubra]